MDKTTKTAAKMEIGRSLKLCIFSMQFIGLSFDKPRNNKAYFRQEIIFLLCLCNGCCHVTTELLNIIVTFASSPHIEDVVPLFHTFGYGALSIAKFIVLRYKNSEFGELINKLSEIWPMPPLDENASKIKEKSVKALRFSHCWYFSLSVVSVTFFVVTPIIIYFYRVWKGEDAEVGYVWIAWYPFDKHHPVAHVAVYLFEMYAGYACLCTMLSSDLLFFAMASHITLLLRILKWQIESLASTDKTDAEYYEEICSNIKLHQKLIRLVDYCNYLEDAFTLCNFINVVLSSVNICCSLFTVVCIDPFMAVSNKLFLGSVLLQVGAICWYADEVFHASVAVATAAYNSNWYKMSPRCQRAVLFLIIRSQKPIAFTAMGFTNISLVTYSSILTRSYSYFTLLHTMYIEN